MILQRNEGPGVGMKVAMVRKFLFFKRMIERRREIGVFVLLRSDNA